MTDERAAFERFFPSAHANWLERSQQYSGPYHELWEGWQARGESDKSAEPVAEWRPIATAPRTFSPPLSPINHHAPDILGLWGKAFYCVCSWDGHRWVGGDNKPIPFQPTHWMPLPSAPGAAAQPSAEPVGEAGAMPGTSGFTMACFEAAKVPVGTKLYTLPSASVQAEVESLVRQIHQAVKRGERTQDHGLIGNLTCILDHVLPSPPAL
jgi:hypothetical protein